VFSFMRDFISCNIWSHWPWEGVWKGRADLWGKGSGYLGGCSIEFRRLTPLIMDIISFKYSYIIPSLHQNCCQSRLFYKQGRNKEKTNTPTSNKLNQISFS
jgi:hypothetical protein